MAATAWLSTDEMAANIIAAYNGAPDAHRADGATWYQRAHDEALALGLGIERGAGIIAALSPRKRWSANLDTARLLASGPWWRGRPAGTFGISWAKAQRCMQAEPTGVEACLAPPDGATSGPKVRAFYANIVNPEDGWHVTVDAHALAIAYGRPAHKRGAKANLPKIDRQVNYDKVADAYRKAAATLGLLPSTLQAITWLAQAA